MRNYRVASAILLLINFGLLAKYISDNKRHNTLRSLYRYSIMNAIRIPPFSLPDKDGAISDSEILLTRAPFSLFLFFSPSDCSPCLSEIEFWNKLAKGDPRYRMYGVVSHSDRKELVQWVKNLDLKFSVILDINAEYTKKYAFKQTPFKVFTDQDGRVLYFEKTSYTKAEQRSFIFKLRTIVKYGA